MSSRLRLATTSLYCDQRKAAWVNEVAQDDKTIEDSADSAEPRFHSLDLKLMYVLTKLSSHNSARLRQRVNTNKTSLGDEGEPAPHGQDSAVDDQALLQGQLEHDDGVQHHGPCSPGMAWR